MRGVILEGERELRLCYIVKRMLKQLLLIHHKQMNYYALSLSILEGIKIILVSFTLNLILEMIRSLLYLNIYFPLCQAKK